MNITISKIKPIYFNKTAVKKKNHSVEIGLDKGNALLFLSAFSTEKMAEVQVEQLKEKQFFEEFINRDGKVSIEEYEDIKQNHPSVLVMANKLINELYAGETTPEEMAKVSLAVSETLNKKYGNHRIISLGTSPAPLAEQLKNLGHDVVFLPVSDLNYSCDKEMLDILMKYLKSKGIDNQKLNIVIDYIFSGTTLLFMTNIIRKEFGLSLGAIHDFSLNKLLEFACRKTAVHPYKYLSDINESFVDTISNVPHFPVSAQGFQKYEETNKSDTVFYRDDLSKEEIFKKFDDYSSVLARCFSLCTMAQIDQIARPK